MVFKVLSIIFWNNKMVSWVVFTTVTLLFAIEIELQYYPGVLVIFLYVGMSTYTYYILDFYIPTPFVVFCYVIYNICYNVLLY